MKRTLLIFVLLLGVVGCSGNVAEFPKSPVRECFEAGGMWSQDQCVELPEQTLSVTLEYKSPDLGINDVQTITIDDPSSADMFGTELTLDFDEFTLRVYLPTYEEGTYDTSELLFLKFGDSTSDIVQDKNVSGEIIISDSLYDENIGCVVVEHYLGFIKGSFDIEGSFTVGDLILGTDPVRPDREYQIRASGDFTLRSRGGVCEID